ncbi:DUF2635 domain-containing protein [Burkholderia sp. PU8-34]
MLDPVTKQFIPPEGITVDDFDLYWHRRIADGDARIVDPEKGAATAQNASSTEEADQ